MATYRMINDDGPWWIVQKKTLFGWKYETLLTVVSGNPQESLDEYVKRKNTFYYAKANKKINS